MAREVTKRMARAGLIDEQARRLFELWGYDVPPADLLVPVRQSLEDFTDELAGMMDFNLDKVVEAKCLDAETQKLADQVDAETHVTPVSVDDILGGTPGGNGA